MVIEESLLLRGFETRICASLAKGGNKHRLKVLVGSGGGDTGRQCLHCNKCIQNSATRKIKKQATFIFN